MNGRMSSRSSRTNCSSSGTRSYREKLPESPVERRRHDDHVPAHSRGEHIVEHRAGGDVVVNAVSGVELLLPEPISFAAAHAVQQHEHVVRLRGVVPIGKVDEHPLIIGERAGTLALADIVVRQIFDRLHRAGAAGALKEGRRHARVEKSGASGRTSGSGT